jgi:hypothetical protein
MEDGCEYLTIKEFLNRKGQECSLLEKRFERYVLNQLKSKGLMKSGIYRDGEYLLNYLETPLLMKRLNEFIEQTKILTQ